MVAFKYLLIWIILSNQLLLWSGNMEFSILNVDTDLDQVKIQFVYRDNTKNNYKLKIDDIKFEGCSDLNGTLKLKNILVNKYYVSILFINEKCKNSYISFKLHTEASYLQFEIPPLSSVGRTIQPNIDLNKQYEIKINSRIKGDLDFNEESKIYFNGTFSLRIENDNLIARPYCSLYEDGGDFTNLKGETFILLYQRQGYYLSLNGIPDYHMTSGRGEFEKDPGLLIQKNFDDIIPDYQDIPHIGKFHLTIKDGGNSNLSFILLTNSLITVNEYYKCPQKY